MFDVFISGNGLYNLGGSFEFGRVWDIATNFNSSVFAVAIDDGICRILDSQQLSKF